MKENLLTPIERLAFKKAFSTRNDAQKARRLELFLKAFNEGFIHVSLRVHKTHIDVFFGWHARLTERRIHQHHVVAIAADINEGEAPRRVLGKEPALEAAAVFGLLGVVAQRGVDAFLDALPEVGGHGPGVSGQTRHGLFQSGQFGGGGELVQFCGGEQLQRFGGEFTPRVPGVFDGAADFLLDLEQRAGLAGQPHFIPNVFQERLEQGAFALRKVPVYELSEQSPLTRHRLSADDIRASDRRTVT